MTDCGNATLLAGNQDSPPFASGQADQGAPCLIVVQGRQQGKRYELAARSMQLGRDNTADIVIDDPKVSRKQALIEIDGDNVRLIDGGSTNGTYINQRKITGGQSSVLAREDLIKVGDTLLKYLPRGAPELQFIGTLESRARTDALTQTCNKGYLLEAMDFEFRRASTMGHELSLLVCDLDHFKRINDTLGHDAGDHVLVEIARILRIAVSAHQGLLGRYGGEEFVALLPGRPLAAALDLAQSLRALIEQHPLSYDGQPIRMTASIGVAALTSDMADARALFRQADQAVYLAKNGGRNRVCQPQA